jgi:inorganic pyrophosphatase/exopolyphosphatase
MKQLITKQELREITLNDIKDFLYEKSSFEIGDIEHLKIEEWAE